MREFVKHVVWDNGIFQGNYDLLYRCIIFPQLKVKVELFILLMTLLPVIKKWNQLKHEIAKEIPEVNKIPINSFLPNPKLKHSC